MDYSPWQEGCGTHSTTPVFLSFLKRPDSQQLPATRFQRQKRNERTKFSSTFAKDSEPHTIRLDVGGSDSRTRKRKKIGMRASSAAGRLQPMRARRPSPFSRCTSGDCGIMAGARRTRRNSRPAARTRALTRAHLESEPNDRTRVCQAPRIDISSCPCHADNISISGWRPETPL